MGAGQGRAGEKGRHHGAAPTHWKNLNPLTTPPLLEKRTLRSSSVMEGLWGTGV